ncbi:serine hydrolase domain-containing protein [Mycolicibacterium sp. 120320]|uniref:serine hydrolase domain-containing protein n=1 Tax=unclassified Mycolicibacterium TaxID=2636767 RepID=UPI003FA5DC96
MVRSALLALPLAALMLTVPGCGDQTQTSSQSNTQQATTSTPPASNDDERAARSQNVLAELVQEDQPGCTVAVGRNGDVVWTGVRGLANLETGAPITPDTVMDIGSTSKQFTATAILLLANQNKLNLTDPVSRYVPGLPAWADTVTVSQLIHHQSGIPDYTGLLEDDGIDFKTPTTQEQSVRRLSQVQSLTFPPGSKFEYSNSNYLLLAEVVAKTSGVPLPQFLSTEVFQPLGLAMVMDPVGKVPLKAVSYEPGPSGLTIADSLWEQVGDGAIQTTPSELVRWADNYRTGSVGGEQLLTAQLADSVETDIPGARYAAGIKEWNDGSLDHYGTWAGFHSGLHISKDRHTSLAVVCNADETAQDELMKRLWQIWV